MHKGQQIAGGGLGVLKLTKAQYEANQTWYDSSEFLICITDLDPNNVNEDSCVFPIGYVYISTSATNPGALVGGTWESFGQGRMLISANSTYTAGSTGGSATHTPSGTVENHTLTIAEIPSHTHTFNAVNVQVTSDSQLGNQPPQLTNDHVPNWVSNQSNATGGGGPHNHPFTGTEQNTMPPYISVYMWKRIA